MLSRLMKWNTNTNIPFQRRTIISAILPKQSNRTTKSVSCLRRYQSTDPSSSGSKDLSEAVRILEWMAHTDAVSLKAVAQKLSPETRKELASMASAVTSTQIPEPPTSELRKVALNQAIPFLGFGIMDNAILIFAGDAIDSYLGVALGISTMCAAALGNIVADVAGITFGAIIEDYCAKLGLPAANISAGQRTLRSVRFASQGGCAMGIVVGCLIGKFERLALHSGDVVDMMSTRKMQTRRLLKHSRCRLLDRYVPSVTH